jgi:hypothetical protein
MSRPHLPQELRRLVFERARGICEYCLIPQITVIISHQVDHVIAIKHGGLTVLWNLALSCVECNLRKGTDFATFDKETGEIVRLYNPRTQIWTDHFSLNGAVLTGLTQTGQATISLLQLNSPGRVAQRQEAMDAGLYLPIAQGT